LDALASLNPFRYRGYYYDTETGLYYLKARYYDPELGRFISPDDISFLNPEMINGLNLYAYCGGNPVMMVDETGCAAWWNWLLFGIGAVLVVAAAVVLTIATFGVGTAAFTATLAGSIALKASVGALIGAGIGTALGIAGGAIYAGVTGTDVGDGILSGFLIGFGGGAIIGAVIGGSVGAAQFGTFSSKASLNYHFTKHGSKMGYSSAKEYVRGAKYVIKNGTKISYIYKGKATIGYIKFIGQGGGANFALVGMNGSRVATFGVRGVSELIKLGVSWLA
ncbi:MAG: RHS repeat-associated core domain-containing protein, partial [Erysipelotrichaceae bacterium]|nr:RHS repeat-associated core domain-containing protein [Erysipelotrichaceae bacterium]